MPDQTDRPAAGNRLAIIGAGLAGLSCAEVLAGSGMAPVVFDKGRGPGGRLSTRRVDLDSGESLRFDHGGQYLTVRSPAFSARVRQWLADGVVARWQGRMVRLHADGRVEESPGERFVGTPGMNAIIKDMADRLPLPVRWGLRVAPPVREGAAWRLTAAETGEDLGLFDRVVIAAPAPQAVDLLAPAPALAAAVEKAVLAPCWAVMAAFDRPLATGGDTGGWDAAFIVGEGGQAGGTEARPLTWIARDGSKPGRGGALETWVLHGGWGWSARHLEDGADAVRDRLLAAFREVTGLDVQPVWAAAHRWRYALPTLPLNRGALWDGALGIGACGDWCLEGRGEGAFLSGLALGEYLRVELGLGAGAGQ